MFYSELVKKACNIMFEVHKDDTVQIAVPCFLWYISCN